MKIIFNIHIAFIFLIAKVLLSTDDTSIDLHKYGKLTGISYSPVFFDSKDFKIDDEIYIVITGVFNDHRIYYYFRDDIYDYVGISYSTLDYVSSNKVETNNDGTETRYYTIKKSRSNLSGSNGKYLAIYTDMYGIYNIENTKENKGNSANTIIAVIVVIVAVAAIIGLIVYCVRKRRRQALMNQQNQNIPVSSMPVNVQNNYDPNNNAYNNAGYNNEKGYNNNVQGYNNNVQGYNNNVQVYNNNSQGYNNNLQDYNNVNINSNDVGYTSNNANGNAFNNNLNQQY